MHALVCGVTIVLVLLIITIIEERRKSSTPSEKYIITDRDNIPEIKRTEIEEYERHTYGSIYGKCSGGLFSGYPSYSLHRTR